MYSNYSQIPINTSSYTGSKPTVFSRPYTNNSNDRFVGAGFFGPFLLGGITGGLLAPAFYPRPNFYPVYRPYPYYGPYYR